ncbi:hypothetical protein [Oceanobacillus bengalensis]|nr:hypothetical protein [Oceanobacillus bengalensis]
MAEVKKKKDRSWIFDILFWFWDIFIYIPRLVGRVIKEVFFNG